MVLIRNILIIILMVLGHTEVSAQAFEIKYGIEVFKNKKVLNKVSDFTQAVFKEMDSLEMELVFDDSRSIFRPPKGPEIGLEKERTIKAARLFPIGITQAYYHSLDGREFYLLKSYADNEYLIKAEYVPMDWELIAEEKTILGHQCFKAVTYKKEPNRLGET